MKYQQTLFKIIEDVVNPKILKKQNRNKKWEYGYNSDYDFIVISKTGQIGEIIEIQNLRIALPAVNKAAGCVTHKRKGCDAGSRDASWPQWPAGVPG